MPKPIMMTEEMIEESFADVREKFETAYAKAFAEAKSGKKLADGKFEFKFPGIDWAWKNNKERAKLTIETNAYLKIMQLVQKCPDEIAWHGVIERDPEDQNNFILSDVFLFPQKVAASTVVTDDDKYAEWVATVPDDTFFKMRYHGHSHVNMGVSPSGTDLDYRNDMLGQFKDGFYVFMIINKREDVSCQIYDFDNNALYDDKEIDVVVNDNWATKLNEDMEKFVTKQSYGSTTYSYKGKRAYGGRDYSGYGGGGYYDYDLKKYVYPGDADYDPNWYKED